MLASNQTGSKDVTGGVALSEGAGLSKGAAQDGSADPVGDSPLIWLTK